MIKKPRLLKIQVVWEKKGHRKTGMGPDKIDKTPRKAPWPPFCSKNAPWPRCFPTQMRDKLDLTPITLDRDSPAPSHHVPMALTLHPKNVAKDCPWTGQIPCEQFHGAAPHTTPPWALREGFSSSFASFATKPKYPLVL